VLTQQRGELRDERMSRIAASVFGATRRAGTPW
jgi:hypothetical protein